MLEVRNSSMDPQEAAGFEVGKWVSSHPLTLSLMMFSITAASQFISGEQPRKRYLLSPSLVILVVTVYVDWFESWQLQHWAGLCGALGSIVWFICTLSNQKRLWLAVCLLYLLGTLLAMDAGK